MSVKMEMSCPQCNAVCRVTVEDGELAEHQIMSEAIGECDCCGCIFSFDFDVDITNKKVLGRQGHEKS